ncbi:heme ABC exporter ATP-binding protein CcmA [Permianibacter aggregans]|uniref:Heme exporter protein A n=1 Tax=Permianibacter aggregans TaxID=1510150 RepID=A0A4R6UVC6_9GAMM|nr:heme ABC exporter ATP-binding protein CcmA [Permianibacter aggregans]QGX41393.1 cytochrome c biogenesis heme-transporting ATPase CcmA [Permianibacter aggregans]TDQ51182.1 heme exporter protein A [Permianibacter aggregans]
MNPILLSAEALSVQRGDRLLIEGLGFTLSAGEGMHLTGTNGAGKTSLLRVLAGLGHALEGLVNVRAGARLIYLGHALGLKPELTVTENLRFLLQVTDLKEKTTVDEALSEVGLARYFDIPVANLSAGQKKRVGLARLLLEPADLWLLDEPFSALDARSCQWLCDRIDLFLAEGGAVLLTSHQQVPVRHPLRRLELGAR